MAAVPATITVSFTSNYAGPHRVCYRTNNSGTYTCATVVCTGGGATCSYDVGVTVDNETCEEVIFDGYVQAECNDINSEVDRIPFLSTFTPTPSCVKYTATCDYSSVASVTIDDAGDGYNPLSPPSVSFSGGGGAGAIASATVGTGFITTTSISYSVVGAGYTPGVYTNVPLLGGSGSGATGDFTVGGGGIPVTASINNPGNGYLNDETLTPDPTAMGPSTPSTTAEFKVTTDYGTITNISVSNNGDNYTSAPLVTIAPGSGVQATGTAVLAFCDSFNSNGCSGSPVAVADLLLPGESVEICSNSGVTLPAQYSQVTNGNCLCACNHYTFTVPEKGGSYEYTYTACDGAAVIGTITESDSPNYLAACMVTGSFIYEGIGGNDVPPTLVGTDC